MKIFYIAIFCLCAISAYSQTTRAKNAKQETNGSYSFRSAAISVRNHETKAEVFTRAFNDTVFLKEMKELPFPVQPVFLSAYIQSGMLSACTLWNNLKEYNVVDEGRLLLPAKESDADLNAKSEDDMFSPSYSLSPLYILTIEDNTATFTFPEIYGNSQYDFTLEGTFTITLVRDEPYKDTL
ncbi:MAG: hypothetical protein LBV43_00680 [Prevotella sp.]|jgi:hypothetical protein|nr:hypothetical protein [Prevotella sp.]